MTRSDGELGIIFVRAQDGLSISLELPKWKLDRGNLIPFVLRQVRGRWTQRPWRKRKE